MKKLYVSFGDVLVKINRLEFLVKDYDPDCIVGVLYGGGVPAVMLARRLSKPLYLIGVRHYEDDQPAELSVWQPPTEVRGRVLVVDDIVDTGGTVAKVLEAIEKGADSVRVASLFYKTHSTVKPDYFCEEVDPELWVVFPWEL